MNSSKFNHDRSKIVSCGDDMTIKLWDVASHESIATLKGHTDSVLSAAFNDDDSKIVSCSKDKSIKLWDGRIFVCLVTLYTHDIII